MADPFNSNERQTAPVRGVFDKGPVDFTGKSPTPPQKPQKTAQEAPGPRKDAFPDVFRQQEEMLQNVKRPPPIATPEEENVSKLNDALSGGMDIMDEEDNISPEDMKLAEQLIFSGYAEKSVEMPRFPGKTFTITSTSAEEMGVIDDIVFERIRAEKQNLDGSVEMPENAVKILRNSLFVAISYRGPDNKDFAADPICHLNTLKKGILKLGDLMNDGNMDNAIKLKESIKKALLKRSTMVKRFPTSLIDFLTDSKYKFDIKMLNIMNDKNVLPKS